MCLSLLRACGGHWGRRLGKGWVREYHVIGTEPSPPAHLLPVRSLTPCHLRITACLHSGFVDISIVCELQITP